MLKAEQPALQPSRTSFWKDAVFWFVIVFGVGYGAVYNFLPATFPVFEREFGSSLAQMGQVQFLQPPLAALSQVRDVLATGALYVAVVLGFCHGLAHAGMFSFIGQLYIHKLHIDAAHAAYCISVNAAGILRWSWARSTSFSRTLPIVAGSAN